MLICFEITRIRYWHYFAVIRIISDYFVIIHHLLVLGRPLLVWRRLPVQ